MPDQFIQDAVLSLQGIVGLGKVTDLQAGPQVHFAAQRLKLAQQDFEKGGLAAAVRPDQRGAFAAAQLDFAAGEERVAG